jgi:membrane protein DedA with SNARE-associated domain
MSIEAAWAAATAFAKTHIAWAEPIVFALGFAEGIPALSFFVPSSALFLAIGGAHSAVGGEFWMLWLAASCGAALGDYATYSLGRWLRHDVKRLRYFAVHPEALERAHALFERWGALAVIGGKFTGFARPLIPVAAGIVAMPLPKFVAASAVSSMAWAAVFLAPGYGLRFLVD